MGRPNKLKKTLLIKLVTIRYTEKEYDHIQRIYSKTPYPSLSAFLRAITLEPDFVRSVIEESESDTIAEQIKAIKEVKHEIGCIGNNINQIAKVVNARKYGNREEIDMVLTEMNKIYALLFNMPK